jgi:hypothetical protein
MPIIPDITGSPLTRDQYLNQERQKMIDQSIVNSNNKTQLTAPRLLRYANEKV